MLGAVLAVQVAALRVVRLVKLLALHGVTLAEVVFRLVAAFALMRGVLIRSGLLLFFAGAFALGDRAAGIGGRRL